MSFPHDESTSDLREVSSASPTHDAHVETEMAALAARFINSTNRHVFLTGKAGTGKTTFLHRLAASTHKRYVILAPTGIAALNAKGVTIHSQFLLPFGSFVPERQLPADIAHGSFHDQDTLTRRHPLNNIRRNVLREVDLLIIDEVSMLRADLLDAIDFRMRAVRQNRNQSFGGAQVLLIGDLYQLPPVVKDDEWRVLQRWYRSPHFFESRVMREHGYAHIELDRIFRQQDGDFIHILNNLRNNTITASDVAALNRHYKEVIPPAEKEGTITLTTHNRTADTINQQALADLPGRSYTFDAITDGDFPESMYPVLERIELKEGAQVMFVKNDVDKAYFNGKLARVESLDKDGITVRMYDGVGDTLAPGTYKLKRETWENKRYTVNASTKEQEEQLLGTFEQYPVKLAWAITVHKSQGLTFNKAIIDVGSAFAPGQVYVALSRLRSMDGLILRTRIDPSVVSSDAEVVAFTERGAAQEPLPQQLKARQREYLQQLLTGTFDLGDLQRKVEWTMKDHPETAQFEEDTMKTALQVLRDSLRAEEENTQKFRNQLMRLLYEERTEELQERIAKGAGYYGGMLQTSMRALFQHLAQVELLSKAKEYGNALKEIDGMLNKKIGTMAKVGYMAGCILRGEEIERQKDIEQGLAAKRAAMVGEARAWAEEHRPKGRSGKKRKRRTPGDDPADEPGMVDPGDRTVKARREGKPAKGGTYETTYALVREGMGIDEIAASRSMARSTIEGHFARGIGEGQLEIDALMPMEERETIADWMRENEGKGLNDARANFGDRFSFGQLRMVQAWVKREA